MVEKYSSQPRKRLFIIFLTTPLDKEPNKFKYNNKNLVKNQASQPKRLFVFSIAQLGKIITKDKVD